MSPLSYSVLFCRSAVAVDTFNYGARCCSLSKPVFPYGNRVDKGNARCGRTHMRPYVGEWACRCALGAPCAHAWPCVGAWAYACAPVAPCGHPCPCVALHMTPVYAPMRSRNANFNHERLLQVSHDFLFTWSIVRTKGEVVGNIRLSFLQKLSYFFIRFFTAEVNVFEVDGVSFRIY